MSVALQRVAPMGQRVSEAAAAMKIMHIYQLSMDGSAADQPKAG